MYEMSHFQENIFGFLSTVDGNYVTREDNGNYIIFRVVIFHVHVNHYNEFNNTELYIRDLRLYMSGKNSICQMTQKKYNKYRFDNDSCWWLCFAI